MSYLTSTGSMFSLTAATEMLCFASGYSCLSNVNMHSDSKLLIFFQSTSVTFSSVFPASLTPAPQEQNFCMRSQIRLGYLTVWHFQRSQPLLVRLVPSMLIFVFDTGFCGAGCQRSGPLWGRSAQPINSQHALWDPSSLPPLLWSHRPNLWPYDLLNMLQNYSSSGSVKRSARAQRGLSDKAMGTKAREGEENKTGEQLTPSFSMSKIRYCSFAWLRLNFLQSARQRAPVLQRAGLSFVAYFCHGQTMRIRRLLL